MSATTTKTSLLKGLASSPDPFHTATPASINSSGTSSGSKRGRPTDSFYNSAVTPRKSTARRIRPTHISDKPTTIQDGPSLANLICDLDGNLHLEPTPRRTPLFSPFSDRKAELTRTPVFSQQKRGFEEFASPGFTFNSPTPTMFGRQVKHPRSAPPLVGSPCNKFARVQPPLSLSRERLNVDEDSSFEDGGSLFSLPRMRNRAPTLDTINEGFPENTPLRNSTTACKLQRGLSRTSAIPSFLPLEEEDVRESTAIGSTLADADDQDLMLLPKPMVLMDAISPLAHTPQADRHLLPCTTSTTDSIMRVDASTVHDLLNGQFQHLFDEQLVVDCRFPYEFEGGHIKGAANAPTIDALEKLLLERPRTGKRLVVILHCEYSIQRAPSMASHLRRRDREVNMHRYPHLHYPEVYVLEGGYRNFFNQHKPLCEPQNYIEMNDRAHTSDCRQRMQQFTRQFKRTKSMNDAGLAKASLNKAATFTSGTTLFADSMVQSPTAQGGRTASTLPTRARRLARAHSARPGIRKLNFGNL
ncbi:m-phase inducer phosphatase [Linderina macrospora]|uniref:M-phase inducer phosphatase n=1 Tax=Linderina macrospora TaxID=4868 RepID=A0ACC1JID4_9FUNG|nr:m-phase inducer phosphatase [Linderina macrospora]